jgi:hypothetical protein
VPVVRIVVLLSVMCCVVSAEHFRTADTTIVVAS